MPLAATLDFRLQTPANPATPPAGWSIGVGSLASKYNNRGEVGWEANDTQALWHYGTALSGDVIESEILVGILVSSAMGAAIVDASGNGYMVINANSASQIRLFLVVGSQLSGGALLTFSNPAVTGQRIKLRRTVSTNTYEILVNDVSAGSYVAPGTYNPRFGGCVSRYGAVAKVDVYDTPSHTITISTPLTPGASRTDTCTGFTDGAATLAFSGVSVGVTIASGSFTWTVPMLADGVTWPRLPVTSQPIALTRGGDTANTTANINLPTGHQTLRVGDVVGGAVANFAGVVTDNDRMLGYHFLAAANPLATTKTAYFTTLNSYWVYRNGDVGASTYVDGTEDDPTPVPALPRTDTLYIQEANGLISAHEVTLSAAGVVSVSRRLSVGTIIKGNFLKGNYLKGNVL